MHTVGPRSAWPLGWSCLPGFEQGPAFPASTAPRRQTTQSGPRCHCRHLAGPASGPGSHSGWGQTEACRPSSSQAERPRRRIVNVSGATEPRPRASLPAQAQEQWGLAQELPGGDERLSWPGRAGKMSDLQQAGLLYPSIYSPLVQKGSKALMKTHRAEQDRP